MTRRCWSDFARWMLGSLILAVVAGCGDKGTPGPRLPAATDESAPTVETSITTGTAPGLASDPPLKETIPATLAEAIAAVDLRKLPISDHLSDVDLTLTIASYNIKKTPALALDDVRTRLEGLGFEGQTQPGQPQVSEEFAQASFVRGDFRVEVSITQQFDDKNASSVRLMSLGNVDSRTLPPLPDSKLLYGGVASSIYVSPASVSDVIATAREVLAAAGWQEYGPKEALHALNPDQQTLTFKKNAINLNAFVSVSPAQNNQTTLQYSTQLLNHELPTPADATGVQYDDYRGSLVCLSALPLSEIADFYRQALEERGWQKKNDATIEGESRVALVYESPDRASIMAIEIKHPAGESSLVQVNEIPASVLAETEAIADSELDMPEDLGDAARPTVTLSKAELPVPDGAKAITEDISLGAFAYSCKQPADEIVAFLRTKLSSLGWQENKALSTSDATNATIAFDKGDASFVAVVGSAGAAGGSIVNFVINDVEWVDESGEKLPASEDPASEQP
ncbi:MAG: hypothetical protein KF708_05355 [Pirellulales bacterium]|nr:hypothetical protein [Pirellulales bacterium]